MINKFFARKVKMTGRFDTAGNRVGVTILSVPDMIVKDIRTLEKHGYSALRLEIKDQKSKTKTKIKEVRTGEVLDPGAQIKIEEIVKPGDKVKITGISKGKGFAGVVKRHHFAGGPRTHGQSDRERAPGSSGSTTTPGRVFPGTRRAGHMGNEQVSVRKLKILEVNPEEQTVLVIGSVPGMGRNKGKLITVTRER